jgi:DNA-binding beta-propeller fold protein YncE
MTLLTNYQGNGLLVWPHRSTLRGDTTLYITAQTGNFLYKIDVSDIYNPEFPEVMMVPGESPSGVSAEDPHDIHFNPDKSEYAVTCQGTNEVRFFDANTDSLVAVVPTGKFPQEVEFSKSTNYVYITCMEDNTTFPGKIGSVSIVNYITHTFVKSLHTGYQPHAVEPDDDNGLVYVANRNASTDGPAPHHTTECGGRNGYLTMIDMNTLQLVPGFRAELSVDPYYISIKN